eukprot:5403709-Amphidinium_carterae.2
MPASAWYPHFGHAPVAARTLTALACTRLVKSVTKWLFLCWTGWFDPSDTLAILACVLDLMPCSILGVYDPSDKGGPTSKLPL